jgi:hypothetical protein
MFDAGVKQGRTNVSALMENIVFRARYPDD